MGCVEPERDTYEAILPIIVRNIGNNLRKAYYTILDRFENQTGSREGYVCANTGNRDGYRFEHLHYNANGIALTFEGQLHKDHAQIGIKISGQNISNVVEQLQHNLSKDLEGVTVKTPIYSN